jgi:hypothetical protein
MAYRSEGRNVKEVLTCWAPTFLCCLSNKEVFKEVCLSHSTCESREQHVPSTASTKDRLVINHPVLFEQLVEKDGEPNLGAALLQSDSRSPADAFARSDTADLL